MIKLLYFTLSHKKTRVFKTELSHILFSEEPILYLILPFIILITCTSCYAFLFHSQFYEYFPRGCIINMMCSEYLMYPRIIEEETDNCISHFGSISLIPRFGLQDKSYFSDSTMRMVMHDLIENHSYQHVL